MEKNNNSHHVAWADRIGLNKTWAKGIERIWAVCGTDEMSNAVWGLHTIIINIKNGPQLRKIIDDEIARLTKEKYEKLGPYIKTVAYDSENVILERELLSQIAYFIVQTLEDHGFGFYESDLKTDDAGLDS